MHNSHSPHGSYDAFVDFVMRYMLVLCYVCLRINFTSTSHNVFFSYLNGLSTKHTLCIPYYIYMHGYSD